MLLRRAADLKVGSFHMGNEGEGSAKASKNDEANRKDRHDEQGYATSAKTGRIRRWVVRECEVCAGAEDETTKRDRMGSK